MIHCAYAALSICQDTFGSTESAHPFLKFDRVEETGSEWGAHSFHVVSNEAELTITALQQLFLPHLLICSLYS